MVTTPHPARPTGSVGRALRRTYNRVLRRLRESDLVPVLVLSVASILIGLAQYSISVVPLTTLVIPMVIANLVLAPRILPWALVLMLTVLVVVAAASPDLLDGRRIGGVVVVLLVGLVILISSLRRSALGVAGVRGESMLVDLRDRLNHQARMPTLPEDWYAEVVMRSAGGSSFAGDFLVASVSHDRRRLEVAVVDVSGKGVQAGSRSLLLSGAFGGLLGSLPAERFLPAANDYLLRQDWAEGFATAVHLSLDLGSGAFELRSAGHPPALQIGTEGAASVLEPEGPVLGLLAEADFTVVPGRLSAGDSLLLFTDGLVETPQRDVSTGVDLLAGAGAEVLREDVVQGAHRLLSRLDSHNDDRLLVQLHRR